jgi:hypothetical protein
VRVRGHRGGRQKLFRGTLQPEAQIAMLVGLRLTQKLRDLIHFIAFEVILLLRAMLSEVLLMMMVIVVLLIHTRIVMRGV